MNEAERRRVFDDWIGRHRGLLFKVVRAYAYNAHDQDDLFQEILTQVWNSIPGFSARCAETTWLYRVSLNSALAWTRREQRHRTRKIALAAETVLHPADRKPDDRLDWLYGQIALLDHVDRSLTLMLLDGFSYREMSETLGITEGNVAVKINRIKSHLAKLSKGI